MANAVNTELWKQYNGKGFAAEYAEYSDRANMDVNGNELSLTIESDKVTAIGSKPIGVGVEMTLAEVDQVVAQCNMPDYVPEI
jgi:hypothetical protein